MLKTPVWSNMFLILWLRSAPRPTQPMVLTTGGIQSEIFENSGCSATFIVDKGVWIS